MPYKTVSSKFIISIIYKHFKPTNSNWTSDAIDFIGEAIQGIGYHIGMETKITPDCDPIKVSCHRACYPSDFESLIGVVYNGKKLPIGADVSKYGILRTPPTNTHITPSDEDITKLSQLSDRLKSLQLLYAENGDSSLLTIMDDVNKKISDLTASLAITSSINRNSNFNGDYYSVNPDYIITSFEEGDIRLIYQAFPIDDEGFPKVLDEFNYKKAVEWYIMSMMLLGGYKHSEVDFRTANQFWEDYRRKAAIKNKMPSLDEMERFTNMWTRAKFSRDLPCEFFAGGESNIEGNLDYMNHKARSNP